MTYTLPLIGLIGGVILGLAMIVLVRSTYTSNKPKLINIYAILSVLTFTSGILSLADIVFYGFTLAKFVASIILFLIALLFFSRTLMLRSS